MENDKNELLYQIAWRWRHRIKTKEHRIKEMKSSRFFFSPNRLISSTNNWNFFEVLCNLKKRLLQKQNLQENKKYGILSNSLKKRPLCFWILIRYFQLFIIFEQFFFVTHFVSFFVLSRNEVILTIFDANNNITEKRTRWIMELVLSKRSQKQRKPKKQSELSRLSKLLPDDLYKTITRKSRSYR